MKDFKYDYYRMTGKKFSLGGVITILLSHELLYMLSHRMVIGGRFVFLFKLVRRHLNRKYGLEINSCNIGKGLYLGHPHNITVSSAAIIGKCCNLHKGCTIGKENRGVRVGAPTIGDFVWVGINSTIVGKIKVGNDVMIAPNTFVNRDIPDHSIVFGNPCIIKESKCATLGYINNNDIEF